MKSLKYDRRTVEDRLSPVGVVRSLLAGRFRARYSLLGLSAIGGEASVELVVKVSSSEGLDDREVSSLNSTREELISADWHSS